MTHYNVDGFDNTLGLMYLAIKEEQKKRAFSNLKGNNSIIKNIAIYDIHNQSTSYLFDNLPEHSSIRDIWFEQYYDDKLKRIAYSTSVNVRNNENVSSRPLKQNLLIKVWNVNQEVYTLFLSDKRGKNKTELATFDKESDFFIDAYNAKIHIIKQVSDQLQIATYDW